jgi:integrase
MLAIDNFNGTIVVKTALHLSALFFCRPGEMRNLKWSDINYEENRIEIVASKTSDQLIIPLCSQAIQLIETLKAYTSSHLREAIAVVCLKMQLESRSAQWAMTMTQ